MGERWRLPSADEWRQLSISYGGIAEDSNINRKGAYKALLYTGTSGFNAVLGGGRGMHASMPMDSIGRQQKAMIARHGFLILQKGSQALYLQNDGEKPWAFSVRCVKRVDALKGGHLNGIRYVPE